MTSSAVPAPAYRDVILVGGSAGGVESLRAFVGALPPDLTATVLIVLHLPPTGPSVLPAILARAGALEVTFADGDEPLRAGRIVVAPPDRHLVVAGNRIITSHGPRENGHRPAVDVLFRSAARAYGSRVIAVVLSGALDDGTVGARAVVEHGGVVLVQDPEGAGYPSMPQSVLDSVEVRAVGSAAELGLLAAELSRVPRGADTALVDQPQTAADDVTPPQDEASAAAVEAGVPTSFSCPACREALFQLDEGGLLIFVCSAGHAWSASGLLIQQGEAMEDALWMAVRSLEEKAALSGQLAERASERGSALSSERFLEQARSSRASAELVRGLIDGPWPGPAHVVDRTGSER